MQLQELPTEILFYVARCLDPKSLIALAKTNSTMRNISLEIFQKRKVEGPKGEVLEFLHRYGWFVSSLDLTHTNLGSELNIVDIPSYIADFPRLKELNLVNSEVSHHDLLRSLRFLRELEVLSFTLVDLKDTRGDLFEYPGRFSSIKKLYVEAGAAVWSCRAIMDILNACESIESVHVNFVGHIDLARLDSVRLELVPVPALEAGRWRTLHTIICSRWLTSRFDEIETFLRMLFTHNSSPERSLWIAERKGSYIYERGRINWNAGQQQFSVEELESVDILRKYQVVTKSPIDARPLRLLWGHPLSLRIIGVEDWSHELLRMSFLEMLSPKLEELNLTTCHGGYTEEFRLAVITSLPNLRVLALPICFFSSSSPDQRGTRSSKRARKDGFEDFTKALQELKLKKFSLEGADESCADCFNRLRGVNFIQLCGLPHLEELNLRNIKEVDSSACENLWNRNLRTLRLHTLSWGVAGLRGLVQRCPNLQNLKLSSAQLMSNAEEVKEVLAETANLKQLCLDPGLRQSVSSATVLAILAELPRGIELVHFHLKPWPFRIRGDLYGLNKAVTELREVRGVQIYADFSPPRQGNVEEDYTQSARGRGLCSFINSVGYVPPVGWEVE